VCCGFRIYASADAILCARRLACKKLVPLCFWKAFYDFLWFLFRCVVCCGVLDVWRVQLVCCLVGGPTCRVLIWFVFFCEVTCSVLVLVFVESGVFVACALGFGLVSWPCGDFAGCEESLHIQLCLMDHLFAHVPHSWNCGVVFVVAVL